MYITYDHPQGNLRKLIILTLCLKIMSKNFCQLGDRKMETILQNSQLVEV